MKESKEVLEYTRPLWQGYLSTSKIKLRCVPKLFHFLSPPALPPSFLDQEERATSRDRSLPEQRVSITAHLPISPEFLTLLAPVTDNEAQPEEDQPQHEAPNTTQHLALGRFRLCPWKSKPSRQHPHGPQHPCLEAWGLVVCMRDRGAQKPDRRGEGRQRPRGALMDDGGRMVAPRRHVHLFVRPPRVTFRYQPLRQSPEPEHFRRHISQAELQPGGEGRGVGRVKGPPSHHGGGMR